MQNLHNSFFRNLLFSSEFYRTAILLSELSERFHKKLSQRSLSKLSGCQHENHSKTSKKNNCYVFSQMSPCKMLKKTPFLGITHFWKNSVPLHLQIRLSRNGIHFFSAEKHGIKATDKRETVIAHIIPQVILYNKVRKPCCISISPRMC